MTTDLPARPRSIPVRLALTVLVLALLCGLPWLASTTLGHLGGWPYGDSLLSVLVVFGLGAVVATRVSYRWFDALLLLVPFLGLIFLVKFSWRMASLPYRDWPPRPEEG
jgi:peptidoglycan/LPS O-acetylase OafA/YrhL